MKFYYYLQAPNSIGFGKESERSMIMTKSKRDDIPSTQESLVKWALDNGYSPVTSYTVAPMANRFHLRLESNGKYDFFVIVCIKNTPPPNVLSNEELSFQLIWCCFSVANFNNSFDYFLL